MMPPIADAIEQLTPDWFTAALHHGGALDATSSVTSATSSPFGTGQVALVLRTELSYAPADAGAPVSVIVKLPSPDEGSRGLAAGMGFYESEVRFYRDILPLVDVDTPRCYWGEVDPPTGRFTLVLEDLSAHWHPGDGVRGGTPEQVRAALRELVKLHAPSWNAPYLSEHAWLSRPDRVAALFSLAGSGMPAFRERFGPRLAPEHLALAERLAPHAHGYPARAWRAPLTLQHSDYRLDNLLFSGTPTAPQIKVIDWQSLQSGPPLSDVCIHLTTSLTAEERRAHENDLLGEYHAGILAGGVGDFPLEACHEAYRRASLHPFLVGVGASVTLAQSERGDDMFANLIGRSAELVLEQGAASVLD